MEMKISEKGTKKFTESEKLSIIKEVKHKGLKPTLLKYDLFPATYYYWKKKYEVYGDEGLTHKSTKNLAKNVVHLEDEIKRLKILLADRDLEIDLKDKLLKKMYPDKTKKKW
jgi:putative transposase